MYPGPNGYQGELLAWDPVGAKKVWSIKDEKSRSTAIRWCVAALGCVLSGCGRPPGEMAPSTSPPSLTAAVGPIPGSGGTGPNPQNPYAGDRETIGLGRQLFMRFNCAGCHGEHGGGGMGPSLRDADWIYGGRDAQVFDSIAHGRSHGMPTWGAKLNEDEIWKLVAYIKTLRTRNEIQPPS
jgi:cytochrome c oxidase cbb3-type subunit III